MVYQSTHCGDYDRVTAYPCESYDADAHHASGHSWGRPEMVVDVIV